MNRLSPLIQRQPRTASRPLFQWEDAQRAPEEKRPDLIEDLRLFAVGWLGGLVFFGTFLL
jgi:hypothetical protein